MLALGVMADLSNFGISDGDHSALFGEYEDLLEEKGLWPADDTIFRNIRQGLCRDESGSLLGSAPKD